MALSGGLAACGGGSSKSTMTDPDPDPEPVLTEEQKCVNAGGRWNADMTCTSAEDLAAEEAAKVAAATKAAGTKETEIAAEAAQTTDAGLGGTDAPTTTTGAEGEYTLAIDSDGTTVSITVEGATDAADVMFEAEDMMDGRTMHTRTHDAAEDGSVMTEVALVYNDRDGPTPVAFAKFEVVAADGTTTTPQSLNARDLDDTVDADDDGTATNDFTALTVDESSADVRALVKSASFAAGTGDSTEHTFNFDDTSTTEMDEADEVAGTYNGAMGTYRCNGTADCTVTVDDEGAITAMSTGWVFTPDEGAMSPQPDYDYLHYGFWLKRTTDDEGVVTYNEVETFAGSSVNPSGAVTAVLGSASYSGGAVGVYVKNVYNSDRTLDTATSGHFKANVSLEATFGQVPVSDTDSTGTIAPNLLNTLTGTIDDFMLSGGEENKWSVALSGDITDSDGTVTGGTAKGGVEGEDGSFSATFHGSVAAAADGSIPKPGSVVGEFNSMFSDGSVAGAFGARMDEEEE